jgi:hypothetical protein
VNAARPALRVDRARLANARPGDRERLASALGLASPAATGVDAHGLLLIRKLRMQRPLAAGMEGFAGELIDRIRAAKVEARKGASSTADSVYFEDEVALECAAVSAWLAGAPLPELVRRAVPHSATPRLRWRRQILADPVGLPRVIAALAETGKAGPWLAHFDHAELRAAADLVVRAHGGVAWTTDEAEARHPDAPGDAVASRRPARPMPAIEQAMAVARQSAPVGPARALIAISLLAVRRPEILATRALAEARARWSAPASPMAEPDAPVGVAERPDQYPIAAEPIAAKTSVSRSVDPVALIEEMPPVPATARPRAPGRPRVAPRVPAPVSRTAPPPPTPVVAAPTHPNISVAVESAHAGLFFLLNIFLALGLYGDFTDPARRIRGLSPFELLVLLGRKWIGPAFDADPLAPTLRQLAGLGPRERIGRNFEAPAWQIPADWLAPWPAGPARVVRGAFGTSHWHAAGFPIEDQWREPRPEAWMRRRWVACLARYLGARIARALGSDDPASAVAMLTDRAGSIRIDADHVEIAFSLDMHPLEIRLAGIDRDPGRIPAAGHSIGFRFA